MTPSNPGPTKGRLTLLALVGITIAPVLASYLAYYVWKPAGGRSYGELLPVRPLPELTLRTGTGQPASADAWQGKWLLLMVDDAACTQSCLDTLHALRQYRLAQGKEMKRVERLWLIRGAGSPSAQALQQADGAQLRHVSGPVPLPGAQADSFYLIDPLGNQVMRYPRQAESAKVIKELGRLLKNNENLG